VKHNIFAVELCLRLEPGSRVRGRLKELVASHPSASTPGYKWELLRRATEVLLASEALFEKGCWDFFDDDDRARRDYDMWCNGMITEEGARAEPSGRPGERDEDPRYMTFTISLLLKADSETARSLAEVCRVPEADLWKKTTFVRILQGLSFVSFAAVKSDVFYLIPGDESWGLTAADLEDPKFEYLRDIVQG
jgi:hypothetical protein